MYSFELPSGTELELREMTGTEEELLTNQRSSGRERSTRCSATVSSGWARRPSRSRRGDEPARVTGCSPWSACARFPRRRGGLSWVTAPHEQLCDHQSRGSQGHPTARSGSSLKLPGRRNRALRISRRPQGKASGQHREPNTRPCSSASDIDGKAPKKPGGNVVRTQRAAAGDVAVDGITSVETECDGCTKILPPEANRLVPGVACKRRILRLRRTALGLVGNPLAAAQGPASVRRGPRAAA